MKRSPQRHRFSKSHILTLQQQQDLHRWLVSHAVESAESLVGSLDPHDESDTFLSYLGWKAPITVRRDGSERIESHAEKEL